MTRIADLVDTAAPALSALIGGLGSVMSMTPSDWADAVAEVESLGRLIDAARVAVAAAAVGAARALPAVTVPLGARSGADALAGCAGISEPEARRRIRLAEALTPGVSLTGAPVPERFPLLAEQFRSGSIGVEAAGVIVRELDAVRLRADADDLLAAEDGLVTLAAARDGGVPARTEYVADAAKAWASAIDPDGARPREERMLRRRSFRMGIEDDDDGRPFAGYLAGELALQLDALIESHRRARTGVSFDAEQADPDDPNSPLLPRDDRTPQQQRHDAFAAIITGAARAADAPTIGGAPPAVLITVTADDLNDPDGRAGDPIGRVDGAATAFSRAAVDRAIDRGGIQHVVLDPAGAIIGIGSVQRCFTPTQRRAIAARDGGCVIPGCRVPAAWCDVHHVIPARDGGPTTTGNGVLLCWWHHTRIDTGPWRITMIHGVPHVRGPGVPQWRRHESRLRTGPPAATAARFASHARSRSGSIASSR